VLMGCICLDQVIVTRPLLLIERIFAVGGIISTSFVSQL